MKKVANFLFVMPKNNTIVCIYAKSFNRRYTCIYVHVPVNTYITTFKSSYEVLQIKVQYSLRAT